MREKHRGFHALAHDFPTCYRAGYQEQNAYAARGKSQGAQPHLGNHATYHPLRVQRPGPAEPGRGSVKFRDLPTYLWEIQPIVCDGGTYNAGVGEADWQVSRPAGRCDRRELSETISLSTHRLQGLHSGLIAFSRFLAIPMTCSRVYFLVLPHNRAGPPGCSAISSKQA